MKKRSCFSLILVILFASLIVLCDGCTESQRNRGYRRTQGIENFNPAISSFGVCDHLIPKGFIEAYSYLDVDFLYSASGNNIMDDVAVMCFRYEDEIYEQAKQYYFENMPVDEDEHTTYHSFHFHKIIQKQDEVESANFPYSFSMFAFSDSERVLVMFSHARYPIHVSPDNWPAFLAKYFPMIDWKTGWIRQ